MLVQQGAVQSAPGQAGAASDSEPSWNAGQEAGRVISDKWESAKSAARTAWEALPFSGDAATTAAARERVVQGAVDTYRGLDTLTGPSPLDLLDSGIGLATGDAERAARYGEEWQRTADAYGGIKDAVVDAWQEARERNGTLGAIEMSATVFAFELVGPKGSGAAKSAADLAEAAGDVGRHAPKRPSDVATDDGVHISSNADINPDKKINGRKTINSEPPEKTVETAGGIVQFDKDGFPDFTPYSQKTVRVEGLNGSMVNDVPLAMERAGITSYNKSKYVWHHHQDGKTMMLVPKSVHSVRNGGVAHTGGRAVIQHNANNPDSLLTYPSPDEIF